MKKVFILVDPQNDFISGSLAVPGAEQAMENIVEYLESDCEPGEEPFKAAFVTLDSHPDNHCSFKENGGIWPKHCVFDPVEEPIGSGWDIYENLRLTIKESPMEMTGFLKGTHPDKEEYSIFENGVWGPSLTNQLNNEDEYWVAGIAGDYCVLETLKGLLERVPKEHVIIFLPGIASIDGGTALNEFIRTHNLKTFNFD